MPFTLKKLGNGEGVIGTQVVDTALFESASTIAEAYLTLPGSIIKALYPDMPIDLLEQLITKPKQKSTSKNYQSHSFALSIEEQRNKILEVVQRAVSDGKNIAIITPTRNLGKHIEELVTHIAPTHVLEGTLTTAKQKKLREVLRSPVIPITITTPQYAAIATVRADEILTIHVPDAGWTMVKEPRISFLQWLSLYAEKSQKTITHIGSTIPLTIATESTLTIDRIPLKKRVRGILQKLYTDTKLTEEVSKTLQEGNNVFVLSFRKALYGIVRCGDCGVAVPCINCGLPVTLIRKAEPRPPEELVGLAGSTQPKDPRAYHCHHCNTEQPIRDLCANCGSWRLRLIKPGTESVSEDIKKAFPEAKVVAIDKDIASTPKRAQELLKKAPDGSIIVGTVYALPFLKDIGCAIIPHPENMLSIPQYHILESARTLMEKIADITDGTIYIEAHERNDQILDLLIKPALEEFIASEKKLREQLHYPPYGSIITITTSGKPAKVRESLEVLQQTFTAQDPVPLPLVVMGTKAKGGIRIHVPKNTSEDTYNSLISSIISLHPSFRLTVDPYGLE
jgi:primosomal protein N'